MKVLIWNENIHEKQMPEVTENYPGGIHEYLASFLSSDDVQVRTATLDDEEWDEYTKGDDFYENN